ncbi:hypothetical protein I302_108941 [Kwoniella bestiolae CBS 10118]|uniref:F-box domain-containing protein n=1 Tax=Kwoniella bestiolae CBS 10118 TaxID=1296100 RepID=A0A1B9FUJ5_9TREE|nr:hypothetical protein I302_08082 [Kwoniella bestiolae CBS 10118]OCF22434.1 hypothetical protein I302_08082 [Kwoniella bestiolae CBS 10118]
MSAATFDYHSNGTTIRTAGEENRPSNAGPSSENGKDPSIPPPDGRCPLLDMPGEILSQISSYLPLPIIIQFLSLHPLLLSLTQTHYSPIPSSVRSILSTPPYPQALSVLPHLNHFLPPDPGDARRLFIQVLVRARPKWILENFELLRWDDEFWKEAFERRFLASWSRMKGEEDSWRAAFIRLLGRLEHRQSGCTHEEAWTRFVTLHRNGSASINRMYSRTFDPYEIYDELKTQNNFSAHPTTVRVILHLQDVRILAVGVLIDQPSLFVNPNAHMTLHPPLLRHLSSPPEDAQVEGSRWFRTNSEDAKGKKRRLQSSEVEANEAYFPLVRSLSPSSSQETTYGLPSAGPIPIPLTVNSTASPPVSPASGSFGRILGSYIPGRRRTSSNAAGPLASSPQDHYGHAQTQAPFGAGAMSNSLGNLGGVLTAVRSRDSDDGTGRRRTWSFGRNRSGSTSIPANTNTGDGDLHRTSSNIAGPSSSTATNLPPLTETSPPAQETVTPILQHTAVMDLARDRPYDILERPQPALSHLRYPNFTAPLDGPELMKDLRTVHPEVEDEYEGGLWGGDVPWSGGGQRMAEWDEELGKRRRWVGPMLLIAQIHPSHRPIPHPQGVNPALPLEGSNPVLGQHGMYASLGFEDLETLFPWIELKGSGGNSGEAKRSGLGF